MINVQLYRHLIRQAIDGERRASGEEALALEKGVRRDAVPRSNVVWIDFRSPTVKDDDAPKQNF